jgi:Protein of unknown function (DUF1579)
MRIAHTMIATCMFVGFAAGAALAQPAKGAPAAPPPAGGAAKPPAAPAAPAAGEKKAGGMEMPKPAKEIEDLAKAMGGTWKCTGKVHEPDGTAEDVTGNVSGKTDIDKMWIHETFTQTKAKQPYKFEAYIGYDGAAKKWTRVSFDNMGMWEQTTSDGSDAAGAWTWTGSASGMGMSVKVKTVHTKVSDKEFKLDGNMSMDGGKTWNPSFEMSCKR